MRRAPLGQASAGLGEPLSEVALLGTISCMAPEQFGGKEPDSRSDLFGFGALLFEMLTGRRAFEGTSFTLLQNFLDELRLRAPAR